MSRVTKELMMLIIKYKENLCGMNYLMYTCFWEGGGIGGPINTSKNEFVQRPLPQIVE